MSLFKLFGNSMQKSKVNMYRNKYLEDPNRTIGGKSLSTWEGSEIRIGILGTLQGNLSAYNNTVGIYKAYHRGKLVYIGRAIEYNNGGFRKRLTDYVRESSSGRGTNSSSNMNKYKDEITIGIIPVGNDAQAAELTKALEVLLIGKHTPAWNVQFK